MRFWMRLTLIAWLLTGLLTAPAMAFGLHCDSDFAPQTSIGHNLHAGHKSLPQPVKNRADRCALSCAAHCLSACAGLLPGRNFRIEITAGRSIHPSLRLVPWEGLVPGPALEPPIPSFV